MGYGFMCSGKSFRRHLRAAGNLFGSLDDAQANSVRLGKEIRGNSRAANWTWHLCRPEFTSSFALKRMIARNNEDDYGPLTWVGRVPVYLTTILVAVHVAGFVLVALMMGAGAGGAVDGLAFSSSRVLEQFTVWEFVTYAFVHSPAGAIWFLIEMYLLFVFGREVEKYLGRRAFVWLYAALLLLAPTVLMAVGLFGYPQVYAGSSSIHFAIFVAFVVIYPDAEIFFGLKAKWIALVLLGINSLQFLAFQQWAPLVVLWLECACAYGMMRAHGVSGFGLSIETWEPPAPPTRRSRQKREADAAEVKEEDLHASIDPLLEKISKNGIASLTKRERERLERAREALIEREKNHH